MSSLSFTKLFSSITDSSVWQESDQTVRVWIAMLAMADQLGRIHAAIPGLANRSRVSLADTEKALTVFLSTDPYSRSKEHDGRRIEEIDGGWRLLNYSTYREMKDEEARKEKNRIYQERHRTKKPVRSLSDLSDKNLTVREKSDSKEMSDDVRPNKTMSVQEEAEAEAEGEAEEESTKTTTNTLASSSNELPAARGKLVCTLPLNQGEHEVFDVDVQQWSALYLAVDVRQELRNMKGWLLGNPKLRKTKTGINRFINSWMSRAQNEAGKTGGSNGTTQQNRPDAATDRQRTSQDNIRAAAIRRYGTRGDDGSSPSVQAEPGTPPGDSGPVPAGVGGDISTVRDGAFQGRTLEGIA